MCSLAVGTQKRQKPIAGGGMHEGRQAAALDISSLLHISTSSAISNVPRLEHLFPHRVDRRLRAQDAKHSERVYRADCGFVDSLTHLLELGYLSMKTGQNHCWRKIKDLLRRNIVAGFFARKKAFCFLDSLCLISLVDHG